MESCRSPPLSAALCHSLSLSAGHCRSQRVSAALCRSLPLTATASAALCRSLPHSAALCPSPPCRSLPLSATLCHSLPISAGLRQSLPLSAGGGKVEGNKRCSNSRKNTANKKKSCSSLLLFSCSYLPLLAPIKLLLFACVAPISSSLLLFAHLGSY